MTALAIGLTVFLQLFPAFILMLVAFYKRLRYSPLLSSLVVCGVILLSILSFTLFNVWGPVSLQTQGNVLQEAFFVLVFCFLCRIFIVAPFSQTLFALLMVKCWMDDTMAFAHALRHLWPVFDSAVSRLFYLACLIAATFPLMLLLIIKMVRPLVEQGAQLPFWRFLWIVPFAFFLTFGYAMQPDYFASEIPFLMNRTLVRLSFWVCGTFLTYLAIMRMLLSTVESAKLEEKLHVAEVQTAMQRDQLDRLRQQDEDVRRTQHDLRHHFLVLESLAKRGDSDGIQQYLSSMSTSVLLREADSFCGNNVLDALLRHYAAQARQDDTQMTVCAMVPDNLGALESDACVVVANLLENACEACRRQKGGVRSIRVKIGMTGEHMLAICVQNSYSGLVRSEGKFFISLKHKGLGVGTESVRHIAQHCNGMARFSHGDGQFDAQVLLPLS